MHLSLRLRPDTPGPFIDELRFHLGLSDERPSEPGLACEWPCLLPDQDAALPGGAVRSLVHQQPGPGQPGSLGLHVRTYLSDDSMYDLLLTVPSWLAPWSLTQGWAGLVREESALRPWLFLYVQAGHAYAAEPGEDPVPLRAGAGPFTLTHTTDAAPGGTHQASP